MRTLRLALLTVAAGMLMAPGLGNVTVGDGSATQPIGDVGVGDRFGGCPAVPGTPKNHYSARLEGLGAGTITGLTDQGSGANDLARQSTGTFTVTEDCVGGQPCVSSDGTDSMINTIVTAIAQPVMVCARFRFDALPGDASNAYVWSGVAASKRHDLFATGASGSPANTHTIFVNSAVDETTGTAAVSTWQTACGTYDGASSSLLLGGVTTNGDTGAADSYRGFGLFGYAPSNNFHSQSSVAEVMVYTSDSSIPAPADVEAYLDCWYPG